MIASADLFASTELLEFNAAVETPYSDDGLVPGADPYIAQLVAKHEAEMMARRQWNAPRFSRTVALTRPAEPQMAVA